MVKSVATASSADAFTDGNYQIIRFDYHPVILGESNHNYSCDMGHNANFL